VNPSSTRQNFQKEQPDGPQKVYAQGLVPGIWIAPTQFSLTIAQQKDYTILGGSTFLGETVDPSDPVFQQDIFSQIRALYDDDSVMK